MASLTTNNFLVGGICAGRLAGHMFFDYWRWCVRTLSARCVVLSEVDTWVKAHNRSPTHANEHLIKYAWSPPRAVEWQKRDFAGIMGTVIFHYVNAKWGVTCGRSMSDPCQNSSCQFCTENFADQFWLLRYCGDKEWMDRGARRDLVEVIFLWSRCSKSV